MTDEVWKFIEDHPNYMVSSKGRLINITRGRIIKGNYHRDGYLRYCLSTKGKPKTWFAHQLVARAFLDRVSGKYEVNHKDEDKLNNCVDNLEWCTRKENMNHSRDANAKHYTVVHPDGAIEEVFNLSRFCEMHGLNVANLHKVLSGKYKQHKGFRSL